MPKKIIEPIDELAQEPGAIPFDQEAEPEADDVAQQLIDLADGLKAAAGNKMARQAKLSEVEKFLGNLKVKDFPDLAESPVVQGFINMLGYGDMKPGEVRNKGSLAERARDWTMQDIHNEVRAGRFQLRDITPAESMLLTFQGVEIRVEAGEKCQIPDCFADIYDNAMRMRKQAEVHKAYLMGMSDKLPAPEFMTPETARIRAFSMGGRRGESTGVLTTGRIAETDTPANDGGANG